ncbi:hypothetical protein ACIOHS_34730 [Streptomyces sp. NPDC088253]|uniref:hypothetical protein n=1 Tax=Streptomyces sp. NPDC088253 TaxID=3365846 RepID=UPI00382CDC7F
MVHHRPGPPLVHHRPGALLMAKSWHKTPANVRKYFHPSAEAIAEVTSPLAPGDSRR